MKNKRFTKFIFRVVKLLSEGSLRAFDYTPYTAMSLFAKESSAKSNTVSTIKNNSDSVCLKENSRKVEVNQNPYLQGSFLNNAHILNLKSAK